MVRDLANVRNHSKVMQSYCDVTMISILSIIGIIFLSLSVRAEGKPVQKVYRYFAYGSNVLPATMKSLRRIDPIDATAAILPDYQLRFYGSRYSKLEPSAAFVTPTPGKTVHGVLYTLNADDFAQVGFTEGIPFVYRWQQCSVYPYVGNSNDAGQEALLHPKIPATNAYTLVSPSDLSNKDDVPPSPSYLGIIQEGAAYWGFDKEYQDQLEGIEVAKDLIFPDGLSRSLLNFAEFASRRKEL